jgi:hypothetical protein
MTDHHHARVSPGQADSVFQSRMQGAGADHQPVAGLTRPATRSTTAQSCLLTSASEGDSLASSTPAAICFARPAGRQKLGM